MNSLPRLYWHLLLVATLVLSIAAHGWDFDRIIERAQQRHDLDMPARWRLQEWQALHEQERDKPVDLQLSAVNQFYNQRLRFGDDIHIWQQVDYWATPIESLAKGAADCEDYAIAKYFSLRQLGVANEQLRLTYVKAVELNQAHMVLTYYATPNSEPLVLDNLTDAILPASRRPDLVPVYSFNAEGLWLGNTQTGSAKQLSRWQDLLRKMRDEGFPEPGSP